MTLGDGNRPPPDRQTEQETLSIGVSGRNSSQKAVADQ